MGQIVDCVARYEGKLSRGKALLETDQLIFRGDFRVSVPLRTVDSVRVDSGDLVLKFADHSIILCLGPVAEKWASKILHPKSLIEKLGLKKGFTVALVGPTDTHFEAQLEKSGADVVRGAKALDRADLIMLFTATRAELGGLRKLAGTMKKEGAIWTVYPKGKEEIREGDVITAGKVAGLVDVKVVSFSESHTGLKLVIPRNRR